jgi:DNA-binding MarR family transcriptional regulator
MARARRDFWGLDDSIGYLARIAFRRFSMAVDRRISVHGLSAGQLSLLCNLSADEGLAQHVLSARLGISEATVAVAVQRLEALGLLDRRVNRRNRRETLVFATERGDAAASTLAIVASQVDRVATLGLSAEETSLLAGLMGRVVQNLREASERESDGSPDGPALQRQRELDAP